VSSERPLFGRYPGLGKALPLVELAKLPTPLRRLDRLGARTGLSSLWLKDDGPSSPRYGGNKVRKLELVLAAARASGARSVVTFGYAGSNHATATAVHAADLGLGSTSILLPQRNAAYLRRNLLVSLAVGADIREYPSRAALLAGAALAVARRRLREGHAPFVVAPGGSSPLGTIGFVNAAFELADQVEAEGRRLPDTIYAAGGSLGTVVGLAIGLAALGARTRVVVVRVVEERFVNPRRAAELRRRTVALLRSSDPSFPDVAAEDERLEFRGEYFGGLYALPTVEARRAHDLAREWEGLDLDLTYTAKALACLLGDAASGALAGADVLFWNTCNSSDLSALAARAAPEDLAPRLRRYFEEENLERN
jgi:1-aminocyclopropane-1-carboxylate deaminase/D-cysteine desulfhydrase-like pyridoxal-dependent ACC family enzyme